MVLAIIVLLMVQNKNGKKKPTCQVGFVIKKNILFLMTSFVRNADLFTSFFSSQRKNFSTAGRTHSFPEAMLVFALSVRWLKCSFWHIVLFSNFKYQSIGVQK
jgi:hypothetical protein